jgi:carbonic anhydrase
MEKSLNKILSGYKKFRQKYALSDQSVMNTLADHGQKPEIMVVACCDSRVDPAVIMQCDPGELFVVRNVANIVPPYEKDDAHHGTSAALEFAICSLEVKHLILLGHSQCSGIKALMQKDHTKDDFITNWVSVIDHDHSHETIDDCAKSALQESYKNCLEFPWIAQKLSQGSLAIHLWFFDIKTGQIYCYDHESKNYSVL